MKIRVYFTDKFITFLESILPASAESMFEVNMNVGLVTTLVLGAIIVGMTNDLGGWAMLVLQSIVVINVLVLIAVNTAFNLVCRHHTKEK